MSAGSDESAEEGPRRPLLRVVRGEPTAEELAALVAVVAARSVAAQAVRPADPRSAWGHPARAVRGAHRPGPDGWRRSALPG
ncbi:MAG TPA: acyl-CoA carboxylase epsilon subunit [Nocardioidaceae bacterium]|nr:acyl-CoA carboxylase epsilon subunit [Nocardioidaceae bacterium]